MKSLSIALAAALQLAAAGAYAQDSAQEAATTLAPVTVRGQAEAFTSTGIEAARQEVRLTPGGVTLVTGDASEERNVSSMADMLRYVPGLYVVSDTGGSEIYFSSRGSNLDAIDYDMNGILLLKNGIPVTTADGTNHNRVLNPLSAKYAIVARGANALKYGAATLGGAINFISPTAYDLPGLVVRLNGGGHGQVQGSVTVSEVFGNGFDALLTLAGTRRDGFRDHTEEETTSLYANAGWQISPALGARLFVTYVDSDLELAGGLSRAALEQDYDQAEQDALIGDFQRDVETWRVASKTAWQIGKHQRLEFGLAYENQELFHPIVADFFVPGADKFIAFDGLLIKQEHENVAATVRYEHRIGNHNVLLGTTYIVGGIEGREFGNNHGQAGGLQTLVNRDAYTLTTYVVDRWEIGDKWTLIVGLQYVSAGREDNDIAVDDFGNRNATHVEGDYSAVNPRVGVIYHVEPGFDLFASVSRVFEPPTFFTLEDRTTSDPHDALEAMEGTVVEIGTRGQYEIGRASSVQWEFTTYYTWLDNEILTVKNPTPPPRFVSSNAGDTIHAGIEALVSAHIALGNSGAHAIEPILSVALNEFKFDDDAQWGDNQLPAAPDYVVRGEILYRNANGFYAGPTFGVVGERYADFANSYTVDAYALLGFRTGWSNEHVSVYLEAENLLDEEYVATHSVVANANPGSDILRPGAPLAVFAGVELAF